MREWISLAPIQQIGQSRAEIRSWVRVVRVVYDGGWNKIIKIKKTNYITASAHTLFSGNTSALIATELGDAADSTSILRIICEQKAERKVRKKQSLDTSKTWTSILKNSIH